MNIKQIVFTKKDTAELLDATLPELTPDDILIRTEYSTISCGTEKANITGDLSVNASLPAQEYAHFPRYSGYSSMGIVEKVGENIKNFQIGDRVAMGGSLHKSYNILKENQVVKIDDDLSGHEAAIGFIATFPLAAVRKTRIELGESAMVMGLGILGQLAVQFARAAGASPVIAVDPIKERREVALAHGADFAFDTFDPDFAEKVKAVTDGGVNAAIEVTGVGKGLDSTLDCMKKFGRVALLGCTRDQNFTIDYYRKVHYPGINLIGAHTNARPDIESHPGYFTHSDDMKAFFKLCTSNRVNVSDMIGEVHPPEDCTEVYQRLVYDKNFPTIVQFDWRNLK